MEAWTLLVLLVAAAAAHAEPEVTFPEIYNERVSSRIVSGWEANEGQFPYQLSVRMINPVGNVNSCGGSVIHEEWGLTAAHCTATRVSFVIRAGVVNLTRPDTIFETTEFYNHPLYDDSRQSEVQPHDIALLKFGRTITFNDVIHPIRIQRSEAATNAVEYTDQTLIASGWGRLWTLGEAPENLNWVYLLGVSHRECVTQYSQVAWDSTICARYYNVTSQSTCQGDSGGPLVVVDDDGELSLIGVTSFVSGTGCHTPFPAGFIQPGYYHSWYTEVTGIDFDWKYDASSTTSAATEESSATTGDDSTTSSAPDVTEESSESSSSSSSESSSSSSSSSEEQENLVLFA